MVTHTRSNIVENLTTMAKAIAAIITMEASEILHRCVMFLGAGVGKRGVSIFFLFIYNVGFSKGDNLMETLYL